MRKPSKPLPHSKHFQTVRDDLRLEVSSLGYLRGYLAHLRHEMDPKYADSLEADIVEIFSSDAGLRVLKMFEKSVLNLEVHDHVSDGALRSYMGARNFVLELRSLVANGR